MSPILDWQKTQSDIVDGISAELAKSSEYVEFVIEGREPDGAIWKVFVDASQTISGGLDESLEGAVAWWPGPPKGAADVLSVIPETEQINLRFATVDPPPRGEKIRIYPPRYLEALLNCWSVDEWARTCLGWLDQIPASNSFDPGRKPSAEPFARWLRKRQCEAFRLPGWQAGFLWGPPGTGKTTTLGAVLAQYLVQFSSARILLFSTTNVAVDLALVALDKCLEKLTTKFPVAAQVRSRCFRIGNHFVAKHYEGREHLLPVRDHGLIHKLAQLEAARPDPQDVKAYAWWKGETEAVRQAIRQQALGVLEHARLAAMTTTRAAFTFADLGQRSPYDLVAFDEASQVGLAHALAIAPLGRHAVFAGDPQQLAPIVQAENLSAQRWLGRSMFIYMNEQADSTVLLNEQSRMAEPICRIVSNVFYDGKLRVADESQQDPSWQKYHEPVNVKLIGKENTCVKAVDKDGIWSPKYHGPIRFASAEFIRDLVCELKAFQDEKEILVLTPFRAQRTLIKTFLCNANCRRVTASTVHRAQGSERHTVIFDPVKGDSEFLNTEEARRLINVAISRAEARLVFILSPLDRKNPMLNQIANLIENSHLYRLAVPITKLAGQVTFPHCALHKVVQIKNTIGKVTEILEGGAKFQVMDLQTAKTKTYITSYVIQNFK
jgi:DNA replication ATP-dependent helicase Dna2